MSTLKTKILLLKELLALKEVVDKGSIQVAACENGIKNSNMSQLIKNLEDRFNTKLIKRHFDGSQPTNSAQIIYLIKYRKILWILILCRVRCLFGPKRF